MRWCMQNYLKNLKNPHCLSLIVFPSIEDLCKYFCHLPSPVTWL